MSPQGSGRRRCALAFAALVGVAGPALGADRFADPPRAANATAAYAPDADFTIPRHVIASGSGSGGVFGIRGTLGQADADPLQPSTGGTFAITGGFRFATAPQRDGLFQDGFENL